MNDRVWTLSNNKDAPEQMNDRVWTLSNNKDAPDQMNDRVWTLSNNNELFGLCIKKVQIENNQN